MVLNIAEAQRAGVEPVLIGGGLATGQRQITPGREQKIATGVKLAALRLLPLAADLRHAPARFFYAAAGAVTHRPGDHVQAAAVTAFRGTDLQVVARAQTEVIGGIEFRALQPDIGTAEADILSTHRRLTQGILQIGADRQRLRLHINAARRDVATQVLKLPAVDGERLVRKEVTGISHALYRELQITAANHRARASQAQRGLCQINFRHPHRLRAVCRINRFADQPDDILLQRRNLLRRQRHARHQMEILRHFRAVVH